MDMDIDMRGYRYEKRKGYQTRDGGMPVSKVRHNKKQSKNQPSSLGLREKRRRDEMVDIVQRMYRCGCMEGLVSPGNTECVCETRRNAYMCMYPYGLYDFRLSTPSSSRHAPRHPKKRNREKSEEKETEKDRMVKLKLKIPHVCMYRVLTCLRSRT